MTMESDCLMMGDFARMLSPLIDDYPSNSDRSHGYAWWFSEHTINDRARLANHRRRHRPPLRLLGHPGRLTIAYFTTLIVVMTALLMCPAASRPTRYTPLSVAFFTAVSALSTCGISIVDTAGHWTMFGQGIILISVQLGGLGVMSFASIITIAVNRHMRASQRVLTAEELGTNRLSEIRSVLTLMVATTLSIELITFVALFPGLWKINNKDLGRTLWEAVFFAVSSYNNAGFTPDYAGLHVNSWSVGLPILLSAFAGTLGFPVLLNLLRSARRGDGPRRWTLHTKLTLLTTGILVTLSLVWFLAVEWENPSLFKHADTATRIRHALAAAVMPRTSGFDPSWVPQVSEPTKVFMSVMMFIGGGSTSTAGGIRVTTFAVILLICRAAFTGHTDVNAFGRRLHTRTLMTAVSITASCLTLVLSASVGLMLLTGCSLTDALFETCSAFGLGGYSVGVASAADSGATTLLALVMVLGRLGPMTIAYAINRPSGNEVVHYPTESIVVG